ncbi:MAG: selenide, water dikinase SelD, partial [Campylobacter sp.]|nr:selenide, water dikinase SelD [Campylobacter sp.]
GYKNLAFIKKNVNVEPDIKLCDPQTNGGLLLAVSKNDALKAVKRLREAGYEYATIIGEVIPRNEFKIYF